MVVNKTKEEYREYVDSLSYSDPEWLEIIAWNNEQVELLRNGLRRPRPIERLVDVYYDEVFNVVNKMNYPLRVCEFYKNKKIGNYPKCKKGCTFYYAYHKCNSGWC